MAAAAALHTKSSSPIIPLKNTLLYTKSHKPISLNLPHNNKKTRISFKNTQTKTILTNTTTANSKNSELHALCLQGNLEKALELFESMKKLDFVVNEDSFVALVRLCEFRKAEEHGFMVYSVFLSRGSEYSMARRVSVRLGNAFLSMFVRFGNLGDAWFVFGRMEERDVFSWNVLLGGYAKAGFFDEALCLYHRMLWDCVRPDVYTFPCVLRTCGGVPDLARGREVHVHVIRYGFDEDVDVVNALITMYVKCGDVASAELLFGRMRNRDRISWNAMISGYFENGEWFEGLRLFLVMRECCVDPDLMTLTSVISACGVLGDDVLGKLVHGYVIRTGFQADVSINNSLIQMYSDVGKVNRAEEVFCRMGCKDVITWTTMITGFDNNFQPNKALETFRMMEMEDITPDEVTIASVLSACASSGNLDTGIKLHELAETTGLISSVMVRNTLIDMYSKCKCMDKALQIFHQISNKDVISWTSVILGLRLNNRSFESLFYFRKMISSLKPNSVTLTAVLSACARIGALTCGREMHGHALRSGLGFDGHLPNAILDMYVRSGKMETAMNQFKLCRADVAAWNILLAGCAEWGQGKRAVEIFHKMVQSEVTPDKISFVSLLCACSRSGMVTEGIDYFSNMTNEYCISPSLKHYTCMVDLLGRAGRLEEAYEFIQKMPIKPDHAVWGALLNACRIHGDIELGELAAQHIFEEDEGSVGYYTLLCNLYAESDRWDGVVRVRKMMRDKGLTFDPGCSWVEVNGEVHAFLSGVNIHPKIEDINSVLHEFYGKMRAVGSYLPDNSYIDEVEASKAEIFCGHSERLAIAFALINTSPGMPIMITKNLYMCRSCHNIVKFISKNVRREISVLDIKQFHHFKNGICSCGDQGL